MSVVFSDVLGRTWEVYQVRRTSHTTGAVSPGREAGWLAFTCATERRRLSPFPDEWATLAEAELAVLCEQADRVTIEGGLPVDRRQVPRVVRHIGPAEATGDSPASAAADESGGSLTAEVTDIVQMHATTARSSGETVIGAMMKLRPTLASFSILPGSDAFRAARRVFLEAFYFQKK